jgi:hypothetical protein
MANPICVLTHKIDHVKEDLWFSEPTFNHISRYYVIPSTNNLLGVCKIYLSWRCELVKEEGWRLGSLQAFECKYEITSINLIAIRYSIIFFAFFRGQEGFGYLIFLWRCKLAQVLRIEIGATKCATKFSVATNFTYLIINPKTSCGFL